MTKKNEALNEFKSVDGQGETADPIGKDSGRPADKHNGEKPQGFKTKAEAMSAMMDAFAGMPKEKIYDIFKGMTDETHHDKGKALNTRRIGGTAKDNTTAQTLAQTRISPTSVTMIAKEDMDLIFGGDELSEEFREKATTIFEAALNSRLVTEVSRLEEEFEEALTEALEEKIEQLTINVDKYLSYAIEQWVEENRIAIESGLKAEVVEEFIYGLKNLFEENYVEIPDDKIDVIAELSHQVAELEERINTVVTENIDLKDHLDTLETEQVFAEAVQSLPLTQREKLRALAEGMEYSNAAEFSKKLNIIKETYFGAPKPRQHVSDLTEATSYESDLDNVDATPVTGPMAHYVSAISKTTKK